MARSFGTNTNVGTPPRQFPQTACSIAAWVNLTSNAVQLVCSAVITNGTKGYTQFIIGNSSNGDIVCRIEQTTAIYVARSAPGGTIGTGAWHHVGFTWNGGTTDASIKIYLDGVQVDTANAGAGTFTAPYSASDLAFNIGSQDEGAGPGGHALQGLGADYAMWNVALAGSDFVNLAAGWRPNQVNSANLVGWWPLGGGLPDPDDSGNGHNGTDNGTVATVQCEGPNQIRRGARSIIASSDKVACSVSGSSVPSTSTGTIALWFRPNWSSPIGTQGAIFWYDVDGTHCLSFQDVPTTGIQVGWVSATSGDTRVLVSDAGIFRSGVWSHHIFTWNNGTPLATYYVNGASKGTNTSAQVGAAIVSLTIGNFVGVGTLPCNGAIADFAMWNVVLSGTDIANLVAGVRPGNVNAAHLQAWYALDSYGATENDQSGNANNGTATGTTSWLGPPYTWRLG